MPAGADIASQGRVCPGDWVSAVDDASLSVGRHVLVVKLLIWSRLRVAPISRHLRLFARDFSSPFRTHGITGVHTAPHAASRVTLCISLHLHPPRLAACEARTYAQLAEEYHSKSCHMEDGLTGRLLIWGCVPVTFPTRRIKDKTTRMLLTE
jgi:hypothetical protein